MVLVGEPSSYNASQLPPFLVGKKYKGYVLFGLLSVFGVKGRFSSFCRLATV